MALIVMVVISILDIAFHRIPNKLVAVLVLLALPTLHLHLIFIGIFFLLFLLTNLGAGDLKYGVIASFYMPVIETTQTLAVAASVAMISLLAWRKTGKVALAPTITAMVLCNM